jgi:hypothetical protein
VFKGYRVTLDLGRSRLVLQPQAEPPSGSPYWNVSGQLLVEGEAAGGAGGLFMLDTGAARSQVSFTLARSVPKTRFGAEVPVRGYGGNMAGTRAVRGIRLVLPGILPEDRELLAADLTMRSRLGGVELSGLLGLDLLDGARIVVDTKSRRLEVARRARP